MRVNQFLLIILIISVSFGQLSRIELFDGATLYLTDIILFFLILTSLFYFLVIRKRFLLPSLTLPILLFIIWDIISLLVNSGDLTKSQFFVSSLYLFRWIEYAFLYFIAFWLVKEDQRFSRVIFSFFILISLLLSVLGFFQLYFFPDFSFMVQYGWDPHQFRLLSTFFDPNFIGGFFVLSIALILGELFKKHKAAEDPFLFLSLLSIGIALVLTFSRSAYLALTVVVAFFTFFRSKKIFLVAMILGLGLAAGIPRIQQRITGAVQLDPSARARLVSWENTLEIARDNLLFGVGYNSFRYAQDRYEFVALEASGHSSAGSDSSLLLILATTGIPGLLIYFWILSKIFWDSVKKFMEDNLIGLVVAASLIALLAHSQFVNSLLYPWVLIWFWILVGISEAKEEVSTKS
ncbi:MAG: hypothetical protein A2Y57_00580 [Candidatus Woykebacteria bacterium RBG_13_40_7b]|uniref:O-antigen ligase-related domain-containing protein n=1 Tax=Candidatus Woykebacteria bacterium RBG_13_40_7b TaxID=1802594 RepID=A0A1G1WC88_9BACT|nr:MAG: hypothetical protein A2Y57_00580 [Candidatus Woykebacteria bacterium RBG_13_40_7b]